MLLLLAGGCLFPKCRMKQRQQYRSLFCGTICRHLLFLCHDFSGKCTGQNLLHTVILSIFFVNPVVRAEFLRRLFFLQILSNQCFVDRKIQDFITFQHCRQILPAACRYKTLFIRFLRNRIKMVTVCHKVRCHNTVDLIFLCIGEPHRKLGNHLDLPHTVKRCHIKFPHRFIVFRRISGGHDQPVIRDVLIAEFFLLQKLQHYRSEGLGDAVNFIEKEDTPLLSGLLHAVIDRGDDLAHRVFRCMYHFPFDSTCADLRKAHGTLTRMVCHRVGNKPHTALFCDLLHNCRFSDARRADQENGTLLPEGNQRKTNFISCKVCAQGFFNCLFCFLYVHMFSLILCTLYVLSKSFCV